MTIESVRPEERPLRAREVGELLGLHRDTVKAIPETELPFVRVNARGDRRYSRSDVETYIARRRVG
jgi:excisionase family DNA binding protein